MSKKQKNKEDDRMNKELAKISKAQLLRAEREMDLVMEKLEKQRDFSHTKVVVDMDAFAAAVEMRDNPELRSVPVVIENNFIVASANYAARRFGVKAAMHVSPAKQLCGGIMEAIPYNKAKNIRAAEEVRQVILEYDENYKITHLTVDEYLLDITEFLEKRKEPRTLPRVRYTGPCECRLPRLTNNEQKPPESAQSEETCKKCGQKSVVIKDEVTFGTSADDVVEEIRFRVEQKTGMTCSAGISSNAGLAKICSEQRKPNGQFRLENDRQDIMEFMAKQPVTEAQGIGPVRAKKLKSMGIGTCGDLYAKRGYIKLLLPAYEAELCMRNVLGVLTDPYTEQDYAEPHKGLPVKRAHASGAQAADGPKKRRTTFLSGVLSQ
ncbi:polk-prov protein [Aphelenchoides avenae]|nr:polk-prov protein [Aphelenchus avenae]